MKYKIADLIVEFENKYETLNLRSQKYKTTSKRKSDIKIKLKKTSIKGFLKQYPDSNEDETEYLLIGSDFYYYLLNFSGCLLHSSAVVVDDEAYLFSANSGVGKSTHTGLWLKYLADKNPYILNDDKPALRIIDDVVYAYGTPFSGKYNINENKKVKVKAICFIKRAEENAIKKIDTRKSIPLFWEQTTNYLTKEEVNKLFDILDFIVKNIPIYELSCNMSEEAVRLAYNTMKGATDEN